MVKKLDCKLSPPNFGSCAGTTQNIYDPTLDFELLCSAKSSCLGSTINFHFGPYFNPYMEELKGLWFKAELAAADATINFYHQPNYQGNKLRIAEINCDKLNSCFNTQFILGPYMELEVGDFFCGPGACTGCMIKESATDPGLPCYYYFGDIIIMYLCLLGLDWMPCLLLFFSLCVNLLLFFSILHVLFFLFLFLYFY